VARLTATPAVTGLPIRIGAARLEALEEGPITSVAPYEGQGAAVDAALTPFGLRFPRAGEVVEQGAARIVWSGLGQALLIGAAAPEALDDTAALTDQSDAWAAMLLEGWDAEAVMARLMPIDLRLAVFPPGRVARTQLLHMAVIVERRPGGAIAIRVFRSMGRTAVHEVERAMRLVAARP
jgi:heterotetrameric sarcosine oxidase gamma subunit